MNLTNNSEYVKKQYENDKNLSIRGQLHAKYRTNKTQNLIEWLFEKYEFENNYRIMELGCGNGAQWENRIDRLPNGCALILSDISDGMVNIVWEKYSGYKICSLKRPIFKIYRFRIIALTPLSRIICCIMCRI